MAALTFILLSTGVQLYRVGCIFFSSGFSLSECIIYIRNVRKECLYKKCLEELQLKSSYNKFNNTKNLKDTKKMSINEEIDDIEIINGYEIDESITSNATFYDFIDPRIVYSDCNLGEIQKGDSFMITGTILHNCERFSINFILNNQSRDIALHVNPRLPQNYIVRNSKIKGNWGKEEVTSGFPFILKRGEYFTIEILIAENDYLISINGQHFTSYKHRLPFKQIKCLEIKGDVDNINVERKIVKNYPKFLPDDEPKLINDKNNIKIILEETETSTSALNCFNKKTPIKILLTKTEWGSKIICGLNEECLKLPYYGKFNENFINGKCLKIEGRVKILPHSFIINLQNGHYIWPHPIIAFHFNPRFANVGGKHIICRNSWFNQKWDKEERSEIKTDFMPGKTFTLCIYCGEQSYEIYLNKKYLLEYKYRLKPDIVDTVYIHGDIKLYDIVLEDGKPLPPITLETPETSQTSQISQTSQTS